MIEFLNDTKIWTFGLGFLGSFGAAIWWASSINTRVGVLESVTQELKTVTEELKTDVKILFSRIAEPATAGASPLRLTEFGEKISHDIDAKVWASTEAPRHIHKVKEFEDFEIHNHCFDYVKQEFKRDREFARSILRTAYKLSTDSDQVMSVLAVELRDCLFEHQQHKRFQFRVVDALAPST